MKTKTQKYKNSQDTAKAIFRGEFGTINVYI